MGLLLTQREISDEQPAGPTRLSPISNINWDGNGPYCSLPVFISDLKF
jgi:hypothetical protein